MKHYKSAPRIATIAVVALSLSGCFVSNGSENLNIATYAPVIDVEGQGHDVATYYSDLDQCRNLGFRVQAQYNEQRQREKAQAVQNALIGAAVGAVVGNIVGSNSQGSRDRDTVSGALIGGAIASSSSVENIDYTNDIAKFGPTAVVDRCMNNRGYTILSAEGFGGGG